MKQGWKIMKLGDLCSFERGLTYSKGDEADLSTKGVLRSNNVDLTSNTLNFDEIKYLKEDIDIPVSKKVKRNSLLMCMSNGSKAHLGKVAIIEDDLDYAFGGFMGLLIPNEEIVFPRYFYYALITPMYKLYIKGLSDGANINNLKFADLKEFDILVPPLSEQQRIVALLDAEFAKIDALKTNAEKNLQNAKDLFQAALKKELEPKEGWNTKELGEVGTFQRGGNFLKSDFVEEGYPCIHYGQIHMRFGTTTYKHLTCIPESLALSKAKIAKKGDVIIAITSEDVEGSCKCTAWMGDYDIAIGAHTAIFHHTLDPVYVSYYLKTPAFNKAKEAYTHGFKVIEIRPADIAKIAISFPSLSEQQSIVSRLDTLNEKCKALQANYEKTLSLCDDLKQALLRKAFNGEI